MLRSPGKATMTMAMAAILTIILFSFPASAAETKPDAPAQPQASGATNSSSAVAADANSKPQAAVRIRQLSGAELYSMHCNRCHPERYPTERTAAQWKTILLHMQVRANLPAGQSRLILKYLQENSGR